jgi:hypothetical protein
LQQRPVELWNLEERCIYLDSFLVINYSFFKLPNYTILPPAFPPDLNPFDISAYEMRMGIIASGRLGPPMLKLRPCLVKIINILIIPLIILIIFLIINNNQKDYCLDYYYIIMT